MVCCADTILDVSGRTDSPWHKVQLLILALAVNWDAGMVKGNALAGWIAFEMYGENCSSVDTGLDGYCQTTLVLQKDNEQLRAITGNGKPGVKAREQLVVYKKAFISCSRRAQKTEDQAQDLIV